MKNLQFTEDTKKERNQDKILNSTKKLKRKKKIHKSLKDKIKSCIELTEDKTNS